MVKKYLHIIYKDMNYKLLNIIRWGLFSIGAALLAFSAWNAYDLLTPEIRIEGTVTPVADQEGFVPMVVPENTPSSQIFVPTEIPEVIKPAKIIIDKIELEAPIQETEQISVMIEDQNYAQFLVPEEFAAGWHTGSASIGIPGNTVISGHHNAYGKVFENLYKLVVGDVIKIQDENGNIHKYIISNKMIYPEEEEDLAVREENGRWIQPSDDERLTLVTCWPADSNTHRLILVSVPEPDYSIFDEKPPLPDYLAEIDLNTPVVMQLVSQTITPSTQEDCLVINNSAFNINIRQIPSLNGEIIGELEAGGEAKCIARNQDSSWVQIEYADLNGWVSEGVVEMWMDIERLPFFEEIETD